MTNQLYRYRATLRKPNVFNDDGQPVEYDGDPFTLRFPVETNGRPFKIDPRGPAAIRQAIRRAVAWELRHHPVLPDTELEVIDVQLVGHAIRQ